MSLLDDSCSGDSDELPVLKKKIRILKRAVLDLRE